MSMTEYEAKFIELAKFTPRLVDGEQERVHKFDMGLRTKIRKQDRKSTRLNSSHSGESRMPSSA